MQSNLKEARRSPRVFVVKHSVKVGTKTEQQSDAAPYGMTAAGFDRAAERYDAQEVGNRILERMRAEQWRWLERTFPPGSRLIELGSGTGVEAARLARCGRRVALVDVAESMLTAAAARVREANPSALLGQHLIPAARVGELLPVYGQGSFDGAYSSFGPLNCEPDLRSTARGLARLVKPGGLLVFSVMPKACLGEIAWFGLHGDLRNATRRMRGPIMARALAGDELLVKTFYYNPSELSRLFSPWFRRARTKAFPLLWPPPYLAHLPRRFPRVFAVLGWLDTWLSDSFPRLAVFGDHFLIELERT